MGYGQSVSDVCVNGINRFAGGLQYVAGSWPAKMIVGNGGRWIGKYVSECGSGSQKFFYFNPVIFIKQVVEFFELQDCSQRLEAFYSRASVAKGFACGL